jgi:hypothetical protein
MNQHSIDTKYFWDAIEYFSFDYEFYTMTGVSVDKLGHVKKAFTKSTIRGSLQSAGGFKKAKDKSGSTVSASFNFYCKSIYRVNVDDFIKTADGQWLICTGVEEPYDEYGVRACSFEMTDLYNHKDLQDYLAYLSGKKTL